MSNAELGQKRRCNSCGMKFYDFKKSPIICPSCDAEFDPESLLKSRRGRTAAKAEVEKPEADESSEDAGDDVILNEDDNEYSGDNDDDLPGDEQELLNVSGDDDDDEELDEGGADFIDVLDDDASDDDDVDIPLDEDDDN